METEIETEITTDERILLNKAYIMDEKGFIKHCQSRGLRISDVHLKLYTERGYIKPAYNIQGYDFYDPFQIYPLWRIEQMRLHILDLPKEAKHKGKDYTFPTQDWISYLDSDFHRERITALIKDFEPLLEVLLSVRYYYQLRVTSSFVQQGLTTKLPEILGVTDIRARALNLDESKRKNKKYLQLIEFQPISLEQHKQECKLFDAKSVLEKSPLTEAQIFEWAVTFWSDGSNIDPLGGDHQWRVFIKNIRRTNQSRLKSLRGFAGLAQDFYMVTETLTEFLQDAGKKCFIVNPFDMTDGMIGSWRFKQCKRCGTRFEIANQQEQYCPSCKPLLIEGAEETSGAWKCKKCKKPIFRLHDGRALFEHLPWQGPKRDPETNQPYPNKRMPFEINLQYGRMIALIDCVCGEQNWVVVETGWY